MAKRTRNTLKGYFETGDIPSQTQYADLIDSNLNLSENNTGDIQLTGNITASGGISSSGAIRGASNVTITGTGSFGGGIVLEDNVKANFGTSSDLEIYHDGSNSYISDTGTGDLYIQGESNIFLGSSSETYFKGIKDDAVLLYFNNVPKLVTTVEGVNITGNVTASGDITASGNIIGATGSFDNGIILTAPNGNNFRFVVNNSGHLSITGSAI